MNIVTNHESYVGFYEGTVDPMLRILPRTLFLITGLSPFKIWELGAQLKRNVPSSHYSWTKIGTKTILMIGTTLKFLKYFQMIPARFSSVVDVFMLGSLCLSAAKSGHKALSSSQGLRTKDVRLFSKSAAQTGWQLYFTIAKTYTLALIICISFGKLYREMPPVCPKQHPVQFGPALPAAFTPAAGLY